MKTVAQLRREGGRMDYSTSTDAAAGAAATGIAAGLIIFWIALVVVGLIGLIFWIIMLVDLVKRDFPEKNTWLILMIIGFVFGFSLIIAIIYYFAVYKKYKNQSGPPQQPPTQQPSPPTQPQQ